MLRKTIRKHLKLIRRYRRRRRVKKKVQGTSERPRLCVFRSNAHIYAQLIDDDKRITLIGTSSLSLGEEAKGLTKTERSRLVGKRIAQLALERGIKKVVFDRNGYKYHGRVKALAEGAREGGLEF